MAETSAMIEPTASQSKDHHSATPYRERGHLQAAGQRLEYAWFGPPPDQQPVLVMLHEGLGCIDLWRKTPLELAARTGFPVFAYSRLGYGASDPCPLPRGTDYMHDEALKVLPAVLRAANIGAHILIGHSDGASIALIAAGAAAVKQTIALVLLAPHVFAEEISVKAIAAVAKSYETTDLRERLAKYHDHVDGAFQGWAGAWLDPDFLNWDLRNYLPQLHLPLLLIQGKDDEYGTIQQTEIIEEHAGGPVDCLLLPKCGHSPHLDQPAAVMNIMANFIRARVPAKG